MPTLDPQTFDRVARLLSRPRSRRTTWQMLVGLALSGGVITPAAASVRRTPLRTCKDGDGSCRGDECCGDKCCPGRCFVRPDGTESCCVEPDSVMCVNKDAADPTYKWVCCPTGEDGGDPCTCFGQGGISGSYRRR